MEYQDIVEQYENNKLKTSTIKSKIKIARTLDFKNKDLFMNYYDEFFSQEELESLDKANSIIKIQKAEDLLDRKLLDFYEDLIGYVLKTSTREIISKESQIYELENFKDLSCEDKIKAILKINSDYSKYLEHIKIAVAINGLQNSKDANEESKKVLFLLQMFKSIKSEFVKHSIAFFEKSFFEHLVKSQKTSDITLDEYFKSQDENMQGQYKKAKSFLSEEELLELSEIIVATSKCLGISEKRTIQCFSGISESEFEQLHLEESAEFFKDLQEKYENFQKRKEEEKRLAAEKELEEERKRQEEEKKRAEEAKKQAEKAKKVTQNRRFIDYTNLSLETTGKIEEKIVEHLSSEQQKEDRNVIILYWMERKDSALNQRVNNKTLNDFFERIKEIEKMTGKKTSMFLLTNANRDITLNRVNQLEEEAQKHQLSELVEGAVGGYGTFWIDEEKQIVDSAIMTDQHKEIIKQILEKNEGFKLKRDLLEDDEEDYLRYKFPEKVSKSVNEEYLTFIRNVITCNIRPHITGIKLIHFVENDFPGLDVVLRAQLEAFYLLPEYYKAKYNIGEIYKVDIKNMNMPQREKPGEEHE